MPTNLPADQAAGVTRVLVVEDETVVCRTLSLIFTARGYETRSTESAEAALVLIADWKPDAAILDVGLPKMNGIELAIWIRHTHPLCRILLFSGRPESAALLDATLKTGQIFEILAKPVHPDILLKWLATRGDPLEIRLPSEN